MSARYTFFHRSEDLAGKELNPRAFAMLVYSHTNLVQKWLPLIHQKIALSLAPLPQKVLFPRHPDEVEKHLDAADQAEAREEPQQSPWKGWKCLRLFSSFLTFVLLTTLPTRSVKLYNDLLSTVLSLLVVKKMSALARLVLQTASGRFVGFGDYLRFTGYNWVSRVCRWIVGQLDQSHRGSIWIVGRRIALRNSYPNTCSV